MQVSTLVSDRQVPRLRLVSEEDSPTYDADYDTPTTDVSREWRPMMPPDLFTPELGPNAVAVYGVLALHVNGKTGECWPSYAAITKRTGLSRKTVYRTIKALEKAGFVLIEDRHKDGKSNVYTLPHQKHTRVTHDTPPVSPASPRGVTSVRGGVSPETYELNANKPNVIEPTGGRSSSPPLTKINPKTSTWLQTLGDRLAPLADEFAEISPEFSEGLVRLILCDAEGIVGPVPESQLIEGMKTALAAVERVIQSERNGGKPITNLRPYVAKIVAAKVEEQ
jgi:biotin operon repressor